MPENTVTTAEPMVTTTEEKSLLDKLKSQFKDECDGVTTYSELAEVMERMYPDKPYANVFRQIALDEYKHKKYVMELLDEMHAFMPDDMRSMWKKAEEHYERIRSGR